MRRIVFAAAAAVTTSPGTLASRGCVMSARRHGIALALLLGTASVAGAYATITTASLHSATKPEVVASAAIAKRQARLDAWEASLRRALASKPPQLPALPHYGHVAGVRSPSYRALPAPVAVRGTQKSTPAPATVTTPPRTRAPRPAEKRPVPSLRPTRTARPRRSRGLQSLRYRLQSLRSQRRPSPPPPRPHRLLRLPSRR